MRLVRVRTPYLEADRSSRDVAGVKDKDYFPVVVVANKADLEHERQVGTHEGRELAKHFGSRFIETSAKQRLNVDEAFHELVREIRRYNKVRAIFSTWSRVPYYLLRLVLTSTSLTFCRNRLLVVLVPLRRRSRRNSRRSTTTLQGAAPVASSSRRIGMLHVISAASPSRHAS